MSSNNSSSIRLQLFTQGVCDRWEKKVQHYQQYSEEKTGTIQRQVLTAKDWEAKINVHEYMIRDVFPSLPIGLKMLSFLTTSGLWQINNRAIWSIVLVKPCLYKFAFQLWQTLLQRSLSSNQNNKWHKVSNARPDPHWTVHDRNFVYAS